MKTFKVKTSFYSILGIFIILMTSSCEDELVEQPFSFIAKENFYQNADDAQAAIIGIYSGLTTYDLYGRYYYDILLLTDDQVTIHRNPLFIQMDDFNYTSDHPYINYLWRGSYSVVKYANVAINRIPEIEMDETIKTNLIAEARMIRALMYFNLVRLWGEVPFTTQEVQDELSANISKGSISEIYTAIIADLEYAEINLPPTRPSSEFGRVTKGGAKTLLTDVLLTMGNWDAAANKAKEIIDGGQYSLLANYKDVFGVNNETNNEIILSVVFDGTTVGNWMASFAHAGGNDNAMCFNGAQVWQVDESSDMWLNWDDNDPRKQFTLYENFTTKDGSIKSVYETSRPYPAFGKWNAPDETTTSGCPLNPILYRYADVLLMYAEALSQANSGPNAAAYDAVNKVRRRGYGQPINQVSEFDIPLGLDAQAFREVVLEERGNEFVVEGKRLFDLMRTNQFPQKVIDLGKNINPSAKLFPIPIAEIEANTSLSASDQNEGY